MMDRVTFLRTTELFAQLPDNLLEEISPQLMEVVLAPGKPIFLQGEVGDAVYLVVEGNLILEVDGVKLVTRTPGECIGEFALIDDKPRSATVLAETRSTLLRWEREDFQEMLTRDPEVARGVFKLLTQKLREDVESTVRLEREKERWQQDLSRAREIQMGMLPPPQAKLSSMALAGLCQPAAEVGGDYYDYVALDQDRLGVIICDVTGHGFYAGLFVAMAKSALHTQRELLETPSAMLNAMRCTLDLSIQRRMLMTCCYVLLDGQTQTLRYANGGHPYPYVYRTDEGRMEVLEALDPILGALDFEGTQFHEQSLAWRPRDVLVLYSDGVTEARDAHRRLFDHERLEACIGRNAQRSAVEIRDAILADVTTFADHIDEGDDLTLVVIKAS